MDTSKTNLLAVKRRSLELHKDATENLDACELDHWHPVRRREWTTQTMAGIAFVMAAGGRGRGRGLDAGAALAIAERQHAEWRTAQLRPYAELGVSFIDGPKAPRRDALARLIDAALATLPARATAKQVLERMVEIDRGKVIQEVDRDDPAEPLIRWRGSRRERTTTFKSLQTRLTGRLKNNLSSKIPVID